MLSVLARIDCDVRYPSFCLTAFPVLNETLTGEKGSNGSMGLGTKSYLPGLKMPSICLFVILLVVMLKVKNLTARNRCLQQKIVMLAQVMEKEPHVRHPQNPWINLALQEINRDREIRVLDAHHLERFRLAPKRWLDSQ